METVESNTEPRTYVVGLPVIVTVSPEGFVTVEVDTSELSADLAEGAMSEVSDTVLDADRATVKAWTQGHTVRGEGYAR